MAPKKKGQKVALGDFLADESLGGSWADEMDALPTAPAPRDPNADSFSGGAYFSRGSKFDKSGDRSTFGGDRSGYGGDRGDRSFGGGFDFNRPARVELPIPDRPPFNAFIGNLSFDVAALDLENFFGGSSVVSSVRMMSDNMTGKPKGYCYVEFATREGLVAALEKSGRDMAGRTIRVSVAEPPKEREDRTAGPWRREGPLPPAMQDRRKNSYGGFRERVEDDVAEFTAVGSKFVPASDTSKRSGPGAGFRRPSERSFGLPANEPEEDRGQRMGFGSKFVPSFRPSDGHSNGINGSSRSERKASDASTLDAVSSWRSARPPVSENGSATGARETPAPTRRKLELAPRTLPIGPTSNGNGNGAISPKSTDSKPNTVEPV